MSEGLEKKDKILSFITKIGVVLPIQISKEFNLDTMFAGAILSEFVNENKIPFWYNDDVCVCNYCSICTICCPS